MRCHLAVLLHPAGGHELRGADAWWFRDIIRDHLDVCFTQFSAAVGRNFKKIGRFQLYSVAPSTPSVIET